MRLTRGRKKLSGRWEGVKNRARPSKEGRGDSGQGATDSKESKAHVPLGALLPSSPRGHVAMWGRIMGRWADLLFDVRQRLLRTARQPQLLGYGECFLSDQ